MKTLCITQESRTSFVITDLESEYQQAVVRKLSYKPVEQGFAKSFPSDTPNLDQIYRNFARCARDVVLQAAGARPVPWEETLHMLLGFLDSQKIDWWLVGSAALTIRGVAVKPHDVDLVVAEQDATRLGDLLMEYLIEPMQPNSGWVASWFGRAFLKTRLEWVGGVNDSIDDPLPGDFGPIAASRRESVVWRGREILLPPLDLQLEVSRRRGLTERVEKILEFQNSV